MLISLLTLLLISNALTLRTDKSILFSRVVMVSLIHTSFLAYNNLFFLSLDKGIGIFGGLFHVTVFTQMFNIFILILTVLILTLTSFYSIKVFLNQIPSLSFLLSNGGASKFNYNKNNIESSEINELIHCYIFIAFFINVISIIVNFQSFMYLICFLSNSFLLYSLIEKKKYSHKSSILEIIKYLFSLSRKELIDGLISLSLSTFIIYSVRFLLFYNYSATGIFSFAYIYVVVYPIAIYIKIFVTVILSLKGKNKKICLIPLIQFVTIQTINQITVKNILIYVFFILFFKIIAIFFILYLEYNVQLCDSKEDNLNWIEKNVIVENNKHKIYNLPYDKEKLDKFNFKPHVNIDNMLYWVKIYANYIEKLNIPKVILSAPHLYQEYKHCKVPEYFKINKGLSQVYEVQNFNDYLLLPTGQNHENKKENILLSNGVLKLLLSQHNEYRKNNFNRYSIARASYLDNVIKQVNIRNTLAPNYKESIKYLHENFIGYKEEYLYLITALQEWNGKKISNGSNFYNFQKRQIAYHLDLIRVLQLESRLGLTLNRNIEWVNGIPIRNLFTTAQHKFIVASFQIKFLLPNSNVNSYLIKDFTSVDQTHNELIENILYVQLEYMLSFKRLNYINRSKEIFEIFTKNNLEETQINYLLKKCNKALNKINKEFLLENNQAYFELQKYSIDRVMENTNKGIRANLFNYVIHPKSSSYLLHGEYKYPLNKVGTIPVTSLGLNLAEDFAYHSPFSRRIDSKIEMVTPECFNTMSELGILYKYNQDID